METVSHYHVPVMLKEVAHYLIGETRGCYVDCTLGGGGHSEYLLSQFPDISIIGLDCDEDAIYASQQRLARFQGRIEILHENYKDLAAVITAMQRTPVNGVLLDLGVSSFQFNNPSRGFSFHSENLDMRMDARISLNARDIISSMTEEDLANLFFNYGDERFSRKISKAIMKKKEKIESARQLAALVETVKRRHGKIHPATQVFQALRIAVNNELENLRQAMQSFPAILSPGARVVVLSYHSQEDRIVKNAFKDIARQGIYQILTKKVVVPTREEIKENPRSRSAKLRAAERL